MVEGTVVAVSEAVGVTLGVRVSVTPLFVGLGEIAGGEFVGEGIVVPLGLAVGSGVIEPAPVAKLYCNGSGRMWRGGFRRSAALTCICTWR